MLPRRRFKEDNAFIRHVADECAAAEIRLEFRPVKRLEHIMTGWFSATDHELVIARKSKRWFETLVHELGHFYQWQEGKWPSDLPFERHYAWLDRGVQHDATTQRRDTRVIQECELDAERRAVRMIKHFGLHIDLDEYIQEANCYVWSYEAGRKLGCTAIKLMSKMPQLVALCPTKLTRNVARLPLGYLEQYQRELGLI